MIRLYLEVLLLRFIVVEAWNTSRRHGGRLEEGATLKICSETGKLYNEEIQENSRYKSNAHGLEAYSCFEVLRP